MIYSIEYLTKKTMEKRLLAKLKVIQLDYGLNLDSIFANASKLTNNFSVS